MPPAGPSAPPAGTPSGPLVELTRFPNRILAELARGRLAADGIEAVLFDEGFAAIGAGPLSAVKLMVARGDRFAAADALGLDFDARR